jgi:hypothetical protein
MREAVGIDRKERKERKEKAGTQDFWEVSGWLFNRQWTRINANERDAKVPPAR